MAKKSFLLTADLIRQLLDLLKWRKSFTVTGASSFINTPTQCSIGISARPQARPIVGGDKSFWAIITAATQDGDNFRWTYTLRRTTPKTDVNWAGWSSAAPDLTGYNTCEIPNDSGPPTHYGNGMLSGDIVDADGDYMLPCPNGSVVRVWPVQATVEETSETEYWFSFTNAVHVQCPEEEEEP